ncbi:carboxypeptidase regulatory-like domain-containing protein [Rhodocaloribacter sp.]
MLKKLLFLLTFVTLSLTFPARAQQGQSIRGVIVSGGQGVEGVTVELSGARADTTVTDADGNFEFADLAPGDYTITPRSDSLTFNPESLSVTLSGASVLLPVFEAVVITATEETPPARATTLSQNYPNPFAVSSEIRFELAAAGPVLLDVYDMLGRKVATLVSGVLGPGVHRVRFEAGALPNGLYVYRLETPSGPLTRTMTLMR